MRIGLPPQSGQFDLLNLIGLAYFLLRFALDKPFPGKREVPPVRLAHLILKMPLGLGEYPPKLFGNPSLKAMPLCPASLTADFGMDAFSRPRVSFLFVLIPVSVYNGCR